jgi:hypothetical protein
MSPHIFLNCVAWARQYAPPQPTLHVGRGAIFFADEDEGKFYAAGGTAVHFSPESLKTVAEMMADHQRVAALCTCIGADVLGDYDSEEAKI